MNISNYHAIDNYHRNESELTAKINRSCTNYLILVNSLSKIIAAENCHNLFFLREWRWALRSNAAFKNDDSVVF